jgi:hypothetical protein
MNLYIRIVDGNPSQHPVLEENLTQAFPDVDLNNLPIGWAKFIRVPSPKLGPYQVAECSYIWDGDIVRDQWSIRAMTEEEKLIKQYRVKQSWKEDMGPTNWIFDEETCTHVPPPKPSTDKDYEWDFGSQSWKEIIIPPSVTITSKPYPSDGKLYQWDSQNQIWIPI